jgi:hypothetical protein
MFVYQYCNIIIIIMDKVTVKRTKETITVDIYKNILLEYLCDEKNKKNALTVSLAILQLERMGNL